MNLIAYDDALIEAVAWRLAEADGYKHGRAPIEGYVAKVRDILVAFEYAHERREADPSE